jgi:hypothetical protein
MARQVKDKVKSMLIMFFAEETVCPQSCSLATAIVLSPLLPDNRSKK